MKGNLTDFSLTGLIQVMCSERRQITLLVRHPHFKEGNICFYEGEIIHAQMESLIGIEAMYHLLSWQQGTFRTVKLQQIPQRTIHVPWRHILLEGMKKIDEGQLGDDAESTRTDTLTLQQVEHDDDLELGLITLLAKLENCNAQIFEKQTNLLDAIKILVEMINTTAAFIQTKVGERSRSLTELMQESCENYPTLRLLNVRGNQLSSDVITNMYAAKSTDKKARTELGWSTVRGLHELQEVMLQFIVSLFYSFAIADQWRENCRVFLDDMANAINKIKP